ncbi:MAG: polyprenyl synthetase family protein [Bacteroidales bacterium]|jgi:octaprenyl-diphosphate synthase|nr:polyprenyl synthetase family protein [Bacteroidales bacterium]
MSELRDIQAVINKELRDFENLTNQSLKEEKYLLKDIIDYGFSIGGKRIRPTLMFLIANIFGSPTPATYRSAVILELIHTASLTHDDVLDESDMRRGRKTINKCWDNNTAILFGDYLYGKCLQLIKTSEDFNLLPIYAKVAIALPKGELLQQSVSQYGIYSEEDYFEIIYNKTASLLEASCEAGAMTCNAVSDYALAKEIGRNLGIAYQIKDDILDFSINKDVGKPIGNDIMEKKITLPMIYFLKSLQEDRRNEVLAFIKADNKEENQIKSLINTLLEGDFIKQAEEQVAFYSNKAKQIISSLPQNAYSKALSDFADYFIGRQQ